MPTLEENEQRQEWLTDTLYALRGHFRDETPAAKADLRADASGENGVIFHCADGRLQEAADLHLARGEYYTPTAWGAAIPPAGETQDLVVSIALRRGLLRPDKAEKDSPPQFCIVMGHERCGGNDTLLKSQLDPAAVPEKPEEAKAMGAMATKELSDALQNAKHAEHDFLHERVIRSTVLNSMKNIYDYKLDGVAVSEMVDQGKAHVIGAMRGLQMQEDGKFPLSVYDPKVKDFVGIETLYDELCKGNNRRDEAKIVEKMRERHPEQFTLSTKMNTTLCAKQNIEQIDAGLAKQVNEIADAGRAASRVA